MITDAQRRAIRQYREIAHLLPIVQVLLLTSYPVTVKELAENTSANQETARTWLRELQSIQPSPVTRTKAGWMLTPKGKGLFLNVVFPQIIRLLSTGNGELSTGDADDPRLSDADHPRLGASQELLHTVTTTELNKSIKRQRSSNHTADDPRLDADDPREAEIAEAFEQVGIEQNERTVKMARMEHITPAYIKALHADLGMKGKENDTGLLITLLEKNEKLSRRVSIDDYVNHSDPNSWEFQQRAARYQAYNIQREEFEKRQADYSDWEN